MTEGSNPASPASPDDILSIINAVVDYNYAKVLEKIYAGMDFDTALNSRIAEIIAEAAEAIGE